MSLLEKFKLFQEKARAIIAFNIQNIYHLYILSKVANTLKVPVIAQLSQKYVSVFDNMIGLSHLVKKYQNEYLTFHLDHCMDINTISYCINSGFASVMYDGSSLSLNENIQNTNEVYNLAYAKGSILEAELGSIHGIEDGFGSESGDLYSDEELILFAKKAKFDLLALAIGNAHGHYLSTSGIRIDLLDQASNLVGKQLFVLHGGTGMPPNMVKEAIGYGVVKINVSTALKTRTLEMLKDYSENEHEYNESMFLTQLEVGLSDFFKEYIIKYTI